MLTAVYPQLSLNKVKFRISTNRIKTWSMTILFGLLRHVNIFIATNILAEVSVATSWHLPHFTTNALFHDWY